MAVFFKGSARKAEDETYHTRDLNAFLRRDPNQSFCLFVCPTQPTWPEIPARSTQAS